jgi:hypothetical protein
MMGIVRPETGVDSRHCKPNRVKHSKGYALTYIPSHPRANVSGYVWDHILVIEKHIGTLLSETLIAHHIDFDRTNNDINNLHVCTRKENSKLNFQINHLAKELMVRGILKFNSEKGYYLMS